MGCHACVLSRKDEDFGHGTTWQEEWENDVCPTCGKAFNTGDRLLVDDDNIVYHYDCFDGPKPPLGEAVAS